LVGLRLGVVKAGCGEGCGAEDVDVDEVGLVERGDEDLEDGDGAAAGEVDALEVEVYSEGRDVGCAARVSTRADTAAGVSMRLLVTAAGAEADEEVALVLNWNW
jgi:hypothetical protein